MTVAYKRKWNKYTDQHDYVIDFDQLVHNDLPKPPSEAITDPSDTLDGNNFVVLCDCSSNAITINLPAAASNDGRIYVIKKTDSSANAVTVDGNGSETIDGATTAVLSSQYDAIQIYCDGSNWHII